MRLPVRNGAPAPPGCAILLDMDTLQAVSDLLSRSVESHPFELSHMVGDVLQYLQTNNRLSNGAIGVVDEDAEERITLFANGGQGGGAVRATALSAQERPFAEILRQGDPLIAAQAAQVTNLPRALNGFDPELPLIAVPIHIRDRRPTGVLMGQPPRDLAPLDGHAKFIAMLATLVGQSIQIAQTTDSERRELYAERDTLRRAVKDRHGFDNIVGATPAMQELFSQVRLVAKWNTTVLIRGESGTGKELIANAIHYHSPRANAGFVKLNCAALPDNLLESELFGHEKGAFTGAMTMRKGRFEQADGGTLFLDEIGEISAAFQSKLLRVLQEGEFERVGGGKTLQVDVRIIAATNRNLEAAVEAGEFREDLYYRLNVMPLAMPPLRERKEDIAALAQFLLEKIGARQGRPLSITGAALKLLARHEWPGNVRELENCLERASVLSRTGAIDRDNLAMTGLDDGAGPPRAAAAAPPPPVAVADPSPLNGAGGAAPARRWDDPELDERERVIAALEEAGWVQAKAARLLNMTPRQIAYRIQTLDIAVRRI
ncbi:MAG: nif-specific transcriptional activator NifA [Pseudomonadota bacterium]